METPQERQSMANVSAAPTRPRIGVIIPVFGDSQSVTMILPQFNREEVDTICLVIDLPVKEDMEMIREAARQCGVGVHIIKNGTRIGIGASLRQGFEYLTATGHEIALIMAGNGKDDPREAYRLIHPIISGKYDYVQGSRYLPGGASVRLPLFRAVFNRLYPALWTILLGKHCTDVTNGYRAYRLSMLRNPEVNLNQSWLNGYSLEYYLHYKALSLGFRTVEVPVSKTYPFRNKGGYSRIQPLKDWWPIISPLILLGLGVRE